MFDGLLTLLLTKIKTTFCQKRVGKQSPGDWRLPSCCVHKSNMTSTPGKPTVCICFIKFVGPLLFIYLFLVTIVLLPIILAAQDIEREWKFC